MNIVRIDKEKHDAYMATEYTDDELIKLHRWYDKILTEAANDGGHFGIIKMLIGRYMRTPDDKKAKAFIYQTLALNGIINDGVHDKMFCSNRNDCSMLDNAMKEYNTDDRSMVCKNLNICPMCPGFIVGLPPYNPTNKEYVELDLSPLKK